MRWHFTRLRLRLRSRILTGISTFRPALKKQRRQCLRQMRSPPGRSKKSTKIKDKTGPTQKVEPVLFATSLPRRRVALPHVRHVHVLVSVRVDVRTEEQEEI